LRSVYWFAREEIQKAVESSKRRICRLVVPSIQPGSETPALRPKWQRALHGKVPVVQSDSFQLWYADEQTPQQIHWHRLQIESYSSASPMIVAALDIDERLRDSADITVEFIPGGRVLIPLRFCHRVYLTGLTEVIGIRVEPGPLEQDDHRCEDCPVEDCRCGEIEALVKQAVAKHLGPGGQ
jgi:hypothetical protein